MNSNDIISRTAYKTSGGTQVYAAACALFVTRNAIVNVATQIWP
jgi:hypothetical protein